MPSILSDEQILYLVNIAFHQFLAFVSGQALNESFKKLMHKLRDSKYFLAIRIIILVIMMIRQSRYQTCSQLRF